MDTRTVKKSIGTQVLMVFFLPLLVSGVHVLVAFPMVSRMMQLFALKNTGLFALCVIITFMVFAVVYVIVYLLTARTYYKMSVITAGTRPPNRLDDNRRKDGIKI